MLKIDNVKSEQAAAPPTGGTVSAFSRDGGGLTSCWCSCRLTVSGDYEALSERLQTLPDQLTYEVMVSPAPPGDGNGALPRFCRSFTIRSGSVPFIRPAWFDLEPLCEGLLLL